MEMWLLCYKNKQINKTKTEQPEKKPQTQNQKKTKKPQTNHDIFKILDLCPVLKRVRKWRFFLFIYYPSQKSDKKRYLVWYK